ncbi:hypothetical protein, partial, partial [Parasitella parasitica]
FMCPQWTDHAILNTTFQFTSTQQGNGLWRANPRLAKNEYFATKTHQSLHQFFLTLSDSPQTHWDDLKAVVKTIARRIGRRHRAWRSRQLKRLQRKRNQLFKRYQYHPSLLREHLPVIEKLIEDLQHKISVNQTIRAGKLWREQGETSAGYLKRTIAHRQVQRNMIALQHPDNHVLCETPTSMQDASVCFYRHLDSPDPCDEISIELLVHHIPDTDQIPTSEHATLMQPFSVTDILTGAQRSP